MFERGKCAGIDGVVTKHDSIQKNLLTKIHMNLFY